MQAGQARPRSAALPAGVPGGVGNRGGCPALWRVPARSSFCLWGCFSWSCGLSLVVCLRLLLRSGSGQCLLPPPAVSSAPALVWPLLAGALLGLGAGFSRPVRRLCGLSLSQAARGLCPVARLPLCGGGAGLPLCGCLCLLALRPRASVRLAWAAGFLRRAGGARCKKSPPPVISNPERGFFASRQQPSTAGPKTAVRR